MSDATTALANAGQGAAPTETVAPEPQAPSVGQQPAEPSVQSTPEGQEQSPSGQDLIAPYLEGVDDSIRETVAERLERYRQDNDAKVNQRFEQQATRLKAYETLAEDPAALETPVALYDNLMQNPVETLEWVVDRFKEELGVDLRSQILQKWGAQPGEPQPQNEPTVPDEDQPLTRKQFEELQRQQQQQQREQQAQEQARTTAEGWLNEAASKNGLEIGPDDVAIREAILRQAASLMPSVRDGQQAINMAVEAVVNRLSPKKPQTQDQNAPRTANGGGPAGPPQVDWSDTRQRREAMLSILQSTQQAAQQ